MKTGMVLSCIIVVSLLTLGAGTLRATWEVDGTCVLPKAESRGVECITYDGGGGAIVGYWQSDLMGFSSGTGAIRIDAGGTILWNNPVVSGGRWNGGMTFASDGAGRAYAVWNALNPGPLYFVAGARVYPDGSIVGIPVSSWDPYDGIERGITVAPDGAGGAVIAWERIENASTTGSDICAQKIDPGNNALWGATGVIVVQEAGGQRDACIAGDGEGGAIVAWLDDGGGIYAQRIDNTGTALWADAGATVCTAGGDQDGVRVLADGAGEAFIAWQDARSGATGIYMQRIDGSGAALWTANGITVCDTINDQTCPAMIPDGAGGVITAWRDARDGNYDVYAQRIDGDGNVLWQGNGVPVAAGPGDQRCPRIVTDGLGGAIISWVDESGNGCDVYIQRIDGGANELWPAGGTPVSTATGDQDAVVITEDGTGGAVLAWNDYRASEPYEGEVYAMRVREGIPPVATELAGFTVTPFEHGVTVAWMLTRIDEGATFFPGRNTDGSGYFEPLAGPGISRNGLSFAFTDMDFDPGRTYRYRVDIADSEGRRLLFMTGPVTTPAVLLELRQNIPNPFNPLTRIEFGIPRTEHVTLAVYDARGRLIRTLANGSLRAGGHRVNWDGRDNAGRAAASGIYFYRLRAGKQILSRKMILLR